MNRLWQYYRSHIKPVTGFLIITWMILVYFLVYRFIPILAEGKVATFFIQPFAWLSLAIVSFFLTRSMSDELPKPNKSLVFSSIGIGLSQISLMIIAGFIWGFGNSPYRHDIFSLIMSFVYIVSILLGVEYARSTLIYQLKNSPFLGIILASIVTLALQEPYYKFVNLDANVSTINLFGKDVLPNLSIQILSSFLVLIGGPVLSITYRAIIMIFEWFMPILPNLSWEITAILGVSVPLLGLVYIQKVYFNTSSDSQTEAPAKKTNSWLWILVLLIGVFMIWFNLGIFGVRPFLVSGLSMKPTFVMGDLVIVQKVDTEDVQNGDIVQYERNNILVVHRVTEIEYDQGKLIFITKGDNNDSIDVPVPADLIKGKVVGVIPKIGWISLGIRQVFGWVH